MNKTALFRLAFRWVPRLPMRLVQMIAIAAGYVMWAVAGQTRARVAANLAHIPTLAADPVALQRATRRSFRALMLNYVDFFVHPQVDADFLAHFPVDHPEILQNIYQQGKGAIFVSLHSCGFERGCNRVISLMPTPFTAPDEVLHPPELYALVHAERLKSGVRFFPIDQDATLRELIAALRRGENVVLAGDRDVVHSGVEVPFFGKPARLPTGPIALARLTGAPIVFVISWRIGLNDLEGRVILGAEHIGRETRGDEAVARALAPLVTIMEREITRHPDLWLGAFADDIWVKPAMAQVPPSATISAVR